MYNPWTSCKGEMAQVLGSTRLYVDSIVGEKWIMRCFIVLSMCYMVVDIIAQIPVINGMNVDLYLLHMKTNERGTSKCKVCMGIK